MEVILMKLCMIIEYTIIETYRKNNQCDYKFYLKIKLQLTKYLFVKVNCFLVTLITNI